MPIFTAVYAGNTVMVLTKLDAHALRAIVRTARTRSRKQNPLVDCEVLTKIVDWILKWFHGSIGLVSRFVPVRTT